MPKSKCKGSVIGVKQESLVTVAPSVQSFAKAYGKVQQRLALG